MDTATRSVIVVDENATTRQMARNILGGRGLEVIEAEAPEQIGSVLLDRKPSLVLLGGPLESMQAVLDVVRRVLPGDVPLGWMCADLATARSTVPAGVALLAEPSDAAQFGGQVDELFAQHWATMNEAATILIVDDDVLTRTAIRRHIESLGYVARLAHSGLEAIASFRESPPDLVLLDMRMPHMDGAETCRRLRELPGGAAVPVVLLTANSAQEAQRLAVDSSADDFLTKPFNRAELLLRVRSLLRIRSMGKSLGNKHDELVRVQRQKDELLAFVVHDLKNPLAAMFSNAQFLRETEGLEGYVYDTLHDIVSSAQSMQRMVMNLLDIGRSENGVLKPRPDMFMLDELVGEVCRASQKRAGEHGLTLEIDAQGGLAVTADREMIRRVVENLLDNCLKYSPSGGTVRLAAVIDGTTAEVSVSDQGNGVPLEWRERIFEKYVCVEAKSAGKTQLSRGLGLAFCRMAIEAHGGRIWVDDNAPKGSVFRATFPSRLEARNSTSSELRSTGHVYVRTSVPSRFDSGARTGDVSQGH